MKIKELRQLTGLSQTQFAKKFHIPANTVRGWEQEKRSPPEYVPGMIEEIIRAEQQPIKGQLTINYNPMTDDDILNDDATAAEPKPEQKPQQQQQPQEEINTDTVRKEIFKKINEYLESEDFDGIKCIDCIHKRNNYCDYDCEWKYYKYYKEYKKIIEEELNK